MASRIFVNYRRDDDPSAAARVRDGLAARFGKSAMFMDVDNLLAGQRFDEELAKALAQCDVLLAVIGPRWMDLLRARAGAGERDYVREEIAGALKRRIVVIPVRVGREGQLLPLPRTDELPDDIRDLVHYQKHDVAHERFSRDIADLIQAISAVRRARQAPRPLAKVAAGVAALAIAGAVAAGWWQQVSGPEPIGQPVETGNATSGTTVPPERAGTPPGVDPFAEAAAKEEAKRIAETAAAKTKAETSAQQERQARMATEAEQIRKDQEAQRIADEAAHKASDDAARANAERVTMLAEKGLASKAEAEAARQAAKEAEGSTSRSGDASADPENTLSIKLDRGTILIRLRPDLAPKHVERVKLLASKGFYDGIVFHRVIDGFMAQTGDPTGTGTGGSKYANLPAEFTAEPFRRGTVGAARAADPNSANSQFFICFNDTGCRSLVGNYTVWGQVISGMEYVDQIASGEPPDRPDVMRKVFVGTK